MSKTQTIEVLSHSVTLNQHPEDDFISLTDISRHRDSKRDDYIIQNRLRNRNTIDYQEGRSFIESESTRFSRVRLDISCLDC